MKTKNIFSSLLAASAIMLSSCETLDFAPADQLSDQTFWKTEAQAKQGVVGLYNQMRNEMCFGGDFALEMCTDVADGTGYDSSISRGTSFQSDNGRVSSRWQHLYELIHRSNNVIRNVREMSIDQTKIDQIVGEAKFLRAMSYFRLLTLWGGVPYYDETCDISTEFATVQNARETEDFIRTKVLEDLNDAIAVLPVAWDTADYGRITKGAAIALRGKVYLYNKQWTNAINDFEEIVYNKTANYGYELHPDYESLFRLMKGARSNENILFIENIDGNVAGYAMNIVGCYGNKTTMRLIASNCCVPSVDFVDSYEYINGKKFDWDEIYPGYNAGNHDFRLNVLGVKIDLGSTEIVDNLNCDIDQVLKIYSDRDPRCNITVWTPYTHYLGTDAGSVPKDKVFAICNTANGGGNPMEAQAFVRNSENWESYYWRKWIPTGNLDGYWGEYSRTPYTYPLIRLGDVILMLAEAYNENNQVDKAVVEVNKIRSRAGIALLNNGDSWMQVNTKDEMTQRIRDERAWELAGEGHRYFDIRRWGMLQSTVKPAYDILGDFMYDRQYQARHEIWPIPRVEMDYNPNLTQNPGWD